MYVLALIIGATPSAFAQAADQNKLKTPDDEDDRQIVVIGNRTIIASLKDLEIEQTYDSDRAASYAVSTVGELLDRVTAENGDAAPSVLVNGQPVSDIGDVSDFPVEAISRIEALPKGAASRIGGTAGQRAYNIVLKPSVKTITATASVQSATEGAWRNYKGEALFTYIKGQDRLNLTLRAADSDYVFDADRNVNPFAEFIPYSAAGNLIPQSGTEIDPALSIFAGQLVGTVALPGGNIRPTLADLLSGANRVNPSNLSRFRTLRGASQPYEANIAGSKKLAAWLTLSFNGRLNWNQTVSQSGLPAARFLVPVSNAFTPLSRSAILALNDPSRPLQNVSDTTNGSISATLNANFGPWRVTVTGRHDERNRTYANERVSNSLITVGAATNPFDGTLAAQIPITLRTTRSRTKASQITEDIEGPLFDLPAGAVRLRAGIGMLWSRLDGNDSIGGTARKFRRKELTTKAGITVPLTTAADLSQFLPRVGETELSLDVARVDLGNFGKLDRYSVAVNWRPIKWLIFTASQVEDGRAIAPELLAAPSVVTDNVLFFDPVTNKTVNVTTIIGGAANLLNETQHTKSIAMTANPWAKYNLQLNATYAVSELRNQFGALPPPSTAVVTAFPERFQRDGAGTLFLVDNRTVNFARQNNRELRTSIGFVIPLANDELTNVSKESSPARRGPRPILQVNASHTVLLESKTIIRDGLASVNLLDGGAIGIGGGRSRNVSDGSLAITQGGTGVRLNAVRRGVNYLRTGTAAAPDLLTFKPITKFDLRAFTDVGALLPKSKLTRGTRLTVTIENLNNSRQRVTDAAGRVPISFQPAYLDPIGRTVMFELRKVI